MKLKKVFNQIQKTSPSSVFGIKPLNFMFQVSDFRFWRTPLKVNFHIEGAKSECLIRNCGVKILFLKEHQQTLI